MLRNPEEPKGDHEGILRKTVKMNAIPGNPRDPEQCRAITRYPRKP